MIVRVSKNKRSGGYNLRLETTLNGQKVVTVPWVGLTRAEVGLVVSEEAGFIRKARADTMTLWKEQVKRGGEI